MKNLSKFEAFKLDKVQMNEVKGGVVCYIHSGDMHIPVTSVAPGISASEAADILAKTYTWADYVSCAG